MNYGSLLGMACLVTVASQPVLAGNLTGTVSNADGEALEGVLVRLSDSNSGMAESVYTDRQGNFELTTTLHGSLKLRLRAPYYRDLEAEIQLAEEATLNRTDTMQAMTTAEEISESLPAAYHFGNLPFDTGEETGLNRVQFQRDCLTCHQLGNSMTRVPRSPEGWVGTIKRMHAFMGNFDDELLKNRSEMLSKGFDGKPLSVRPVFPLDPALAHAKIYEYQMPEGDVPHDAEVSRVDGLVYTVDQFAELMAITDLGTGQTTNYRQPDEGNAEGGRFTELGLQIPLGAHLKHGPHSLAMGLDGKWYVTNSIGGEIGVFNPKTREWEASYEIGGNGLYPHTIRIDSKGIVWFTMAFSEQVGRLDPTSGEVDLIDLPAVKPGGMSAGTTPYGIDVNPENGDIWYGRLFGDKIGKIDPETLMVTEYNSPVRGPRRMRFDKSGTLWLTGYSEGILARIEPKEFKVKLYPMPEFAEGYRPAPYALAVHPDTQEIWINETMTDRIYRFLPDEERYIVYPVPLTGTYTRETSFTKDGKACMSNNPAPREALEGGVVGLICIDPAIH